MRVFRRDLEDGLLEQQLVKPAVGCAAKCPRRSPGNMPRWYWNGGAEKLRFIPSSAFAPESGPSEAQLTQWYGENRTQFIRPERRTLRFAVFGADMLEVSGQRRAKPKIAAR